MFIAQHILCFCWCWKCVFFYRMKIIHTTALAMFISKMFISISRQWHTSHSSLPWWSPLLFHSSSQLPKLLLEVSASLPSGPGYWWEIFHLTACRLCKLHKETETHLIFYCPLLEQLRSEIIPKNIWRNLHTLVMLMN